MLISMQVKQKCKDAFSLTIECPNCGPRFANGFIIDAHLL